MKRFGQIFITIVVGLLLFSSAAYSITWTANKRLTSSPGTSGDPAIAIDGSNIYVVWEDNTPGNKEIYFKRSADGGVSWTTVKRLTTTAGASNNPAIAANGLNIYVVWEDNTPGNKEIYFKRSADGGVSWTADKRLTNNTGASEGPAIAANGSNIYVVWMDRTPGNWEIYFKRSVDGGATWKMDKYLTNNPSYSGEPAIAVNGSNIYVVWEDNRPGNYETYFKRSVDGGVAWSVVKRLTNTSGASGVPSIAVNGSNIYLVWEESLSESADIFFKRSVDGGVNWKTDIRLTSTGGSYDPAIAVGGSTIFVAWQDETLGNAEIYFKQSINGGVSWTGNTRITNNSGTSGATAIGVGVSTIYLVWDDDTTGNADIYFKKGVVD
jgi:hypothetical protein